jgi:hypothetical protein
LLRSTKSIPELFSPDERKRAEKKLELALCQAFLGLDESKKANKPTLNLSRVVFTAWISQIVLALAQSCSAWMREKELKRSLKSPYPKPFQAWMRVRRLTSQHSTYPKLFSRHG